ncbi:3'-5' exonuclease domain-containing protein [Meloidogyne graminicola]|uniref:3'-5' exonuclease domain-containing protein n=1 Tax=Meloidogyne graminicola TaxID=189291 RepID=A0A8S9ZX43_9BILA|nr:3'-5' exonuclease domain-containing protein [Meloidogyne graminicola]
MDEARNMALLFFVDHLMLKGGQRTIHDLSQFGARGFTEEMRQSVGTTQEGLTEFLGQFPSLFVLDGDQYNIFVILKGFGEVEGKNHLMHIPASGRQRDYAAEAVQFFVKKLEKFGPELQIKSLLGHRSQAAPEIRLVSGRHLKEFAEFLASQTDHFIVEGDRVRLANMKEPLICPNEFIDEEGRPLVGHKAKLAAIEFMKSVLEQNEEQPYPLDLFYKKFCEHFPHHIRQEIATNPKELLMFLKLNRHLFFIRSNKVQLVKNKLTNSDEQQDSESGRSTEDSGPGGGNSTIGGYSSEERSSIVASPEYINKRNSLQNNIPPSVMFPLCRDNLNYVQFINTLKKAQEAVASLKSDFESASSNDPSNFLVVDFKLVCLGGSSHHSPPEQFIALVIIATPLINKNTKQQGQLIVFDLAYCEGILTDKGTLKELLESKNIIKVTHDVRRSAWLLGQRYGIEIQNIFDTQIAHSVIQHHKFGKPMGELRAISFVNLQRVYNPQSLVLSDISPRKLSQTPNWSDRPVSSDILLSACEESHCLANGLYRLLNSQLPPQLYQLFEQLCLDAIITNNNIEQINNNNKNIINQNEYSDLGQRRLLPPPLMEVPLNGIYRPPGIRRRGSVQPQSIFNGGNPNFGGNIQINSNGSGGGGYIPPPLRKVSAPQSIIGQCRSPTIRNAFGYFPIQRQQKIELKDAQTQTISTGEIAVLKVFYDDEEKELSNGNCVNKNIKIKEIIETKEELNEENKTTIIE